MWGIISSAFLALYGLMAFYIGRRGWTALARPASGPMRAVYGGGFALLILPFPLAEFGEDLLPAVGGYWLTQWGWFAMVGVLYGFLLLLMVDLLRLMDRRVGLLPAAFKDHPNAPLGLALALLTAVTAILVYGGWNARTPIVTEYPIAVAKSGGGLDGLKIAMVSDIHYGDTVTAERLEGLVQRVTELQPDLLLLAGDITEGTPSPELAQELTGILARLPARFGKFAVAGNHDRGLRNGDGALGQAFLAGGVKVLRDEAVKVADRFYLVGRDDPGGSRQRGGRKTLAEIMAGVDPALPVILLNHQPIDLEEAQRAGVDLQVSGHTHQGQIFPASLITGQLYETDWGLLKKDNFHLIVSSGYGTWGPPLRIGTPSEVVSISMDLQP